MRRKTLVVRGAAVAGAGVLLGWPTWAAVTWARYGRVRRDEAGRDPLLDRALPRYEVAETHATRVAAPAKVAWAAATETPMQQSKLFRALVHARERLMRVRGGSPWLPGGIVAQMRDSGWSVLAQKQGRLPVRLISNCCSNIKCRACRCCWT